MIIPFNSLKPIIDRVVTILSTSMDIDIAFFDENSRLISCTKSYAKYKGHTVHTPFIDEVLTRGEIIVSKPGNMSLCEGCRFQKGCPSKAEILGCIKVRRTPVGVISFTSFSQEKSKLLCKDANKFFDIVNITSDLITLLISQAVDIELLQKMFFTALDISNDAFIFIDGNGTIRAFNSNTKKHLKAIKSKKDRHITDIFSEELFSEISQNTILNTTVQKNNSLFQVLSIPISFENQFSGAVIKINRKLGKGNCNAFTKHIFLNDIIGKSKEVQKVKEKAMIASKSKSTVLITGETGTGKELFARAIHCEGDRRNFPFVAINCAGIPDTLLESELFGYEEGAFTGAKKGGKKGKFEMANNGTLFLDEIGDMSLNLQAKLLRVLQNQTIVPVGGNSPIPLNLRIIAATNKDLRNEIKEGTFREDLFYRLNVIPIVIPPLRYRLEDVECLSYHFLEKYNKVIGKKIEGFAPSTLDILKSYDWPGNVRELENTIEYAVNMENDCIIQPESIPEHIRYIAFTSKRQEPVNQPNDVLKNKILSAELKIIKKALDKHGWDVEGKKKAAKDLGISVRTLYRRLSGR